MTYCYALKDAVLNERTIKLSVFKVLTIFFAAARAPFNNLTTGLPPEAALPGHAMRMDPGWQHDGVRGTRCLLGAADGGAQQRGVLRTRRGHPLTLDSLLHLIPEAKGFG